MSVTKIYRKDNQPFAQIPNEAIRDPRISPNAFRLLAYLMSHQDGYEVTYEQIERQTTLGRFAINKAAESLTLLGWLAVERVKAADGRFGAKSWTVLTPSSSTVGHSTMESPHMEPPTDNKKNTSLEDKELRTVNPQPAVEDAFNQFWEIYPLRKEKADAKRAFAKALKGNSLECILEGAKKYRDDPNRSMAFTKYPATWLNKGCWDDDPLPERPLTPEERTALATEKYQRERQKALEESRRLKAEMDEQERRARENPPEWCEHERIKVLCPKCQTAE